MARMITPKPCLTRIIQRARLRQRGETGAGDRPGDRHPETKHEGQRQRDGRALGIEVAREQHHLDHDRGDARAGEDRGDGAHHEASHEGAARRLARREPVPEAREVDVDDVEHGQRQEHEQHRDAALNHGDELIMPNVLAVSVTMTPRTP